jgi:hypothetical protein
VNKLACWTLHWTWLWSPAGLVARLLLEASKERHDAAGAAAVDRIVQHRLSHLASERIGPQQPSVPVRIAIDLAIVRNGLLDLHVEPVPGLLRESPLQLGVLSFEILQPRCHGVRRCTLGAQRGRRPARAGREST